MTAQFLDERSEILQRHFRGIVQGIIFRHQGDQGRAQHGGGTPVSFQFNCQSVAFVINVFNEVLLGPYELFHQLETRPRQVLECQVFFLLQNGWRKTPDTEIIRNIESIDFIGVTFFKNLAVVLDFIWLLDGDR